MIKNSIASLFLLTLLHSTIYPIDERLNNEKQIKELEKLKYEKEKAIVKLNNRIRQQINNGFNDRRMLLVSWDPMDEAAKEESFAKFIHDVSVAFDTGEDTGPIFAKAPLREHGDHAYLLFLRVIVGELFAIKMTHKCLERVQELGTINKKLRTLRR